MTGGPPMSIRGWQTMPTASGMRLQIKQKLPVPLGAHDRRGDLARDGIAQVTRKLAQPADHRPMLFGVADDASLPHRPFADFELGLGQRDHVARWAQELAN